MEFRIIEFESVTSTNDVAMSGLCNAEFAHGDIITARSQSKGRGQRGNRWVSPSGSNLIFSLLIEPTHIQVSHQFAISMMASVAAAQALSNISDIECSIKWPNDLYVGDRKIGGILIEHTMHSEYLSASVIGIGINVLQREFDPSLPNPTSIAIESGRHITPREVLEEFCRSFGTLYELSSESLHTKFIEKLWRRDGFFRYRIPAELSPDKSPHEFEARIESVDPATGRLSLATHDGTTSEHWFKEVESVI